MYKNFKAVRPWLIFVYYPRLLQSQKKKSEFPTYQELQIIEKFA